MENIHNDDIIAVMTTVNNEGRFYVYYGIVESSDNGVTVIKEAIGHENILDNTIKSWPHNKAITFNYKTNPFLMYFKLADQDFDMSEMKK